MSVHCFPEGGTLHRPRTRHRPKAGGIESYIKVRESGCDKSDRWARRAGLSKITPVTSALLSNHLSHIRTERERWHRTFTLCSVVTFPLAKKVLKRPSASTLAERHLHPLQSAIGRLLLRGPQHRGGDGRLKRNLFIRLRQVPPSGLRGPLFGTFAPRHIGRIVLAMMDGAVGGGMLRIDCRML
jgi:hypothetical protein